MSTELIAKVSDEYGISPEVARTILLNYTDQTQTKGLMPTLNPAIVPQEIKIKIQNMPTNINTPEAKKELFTILQKMEQLTGFPYTKFFQTIMESMAGQKQSQTPQLNSKDQELGGEPPKEGWWEGTWPWGPAQIWNFITDPFWIISMYTPLVSGLAARTALAVYGAGLPIKAAWPSIGGRGGVPTQWLWAASKNNPAAQQYAQTLQSWYAAGKPGPMPELPPSLRPPAYTPTTGAPTGVTTPSVPTAVEPPTTVPTVVEPPTTGMPPEPMGPPGTGGTSAGAGYNPAEVEQMSNTQALKNWLANKAGVGPSTPTPIFTQGTGVGGTGLSASQLASSGLRAIGTSGEVGSLYMPGAGMGAQMAGGAIATIPMVIAQYYLQKAISEATAGAEDPYYSVQRTALPAGTTEKGNEISQFLGSLLGPLNPMDPHMAYIPNPNYRPAGLTGSQYASTTPSNVFMTPMERYYSMLTY